MARDVLATLEAIGAIKRGHFLLSSGRHADVYLEKFDLLRDPVATSEVCAGFVERFAGERIDVVVGPTTGGILLAFETARQLGIKAAYAERADTGVGLEIRRGTRFEPGTRVLVLDDILTTGGSVRETLAALESHAVEVVAVGVLVDRSSDGVDVGGLPVVALGSHRMVTWEPASCPQCEEGIPFVKPGTTAPVGAR